MLRKEESTHHKDEKTREEIGKELPTSLVEFYKRLYEDNEKDDSEHEVNDDGNYSNTDVHDNDTEETAGIPEITIEELQTAINKLKKKAKSPDSKGIRAEDVKACDDETREMVRQIFNEIFKRNEFTPEDWK